MLIKASVRHTQVCAATWSPTLTTVAWWLETVLGERAPAHREDVPGVVLAPIIEGTPPTIEHDEHLVALYFSDGGRADEVWILLVHGLQLHAWLEIVLRGPWRFLKIKARFSNGALVLIKRHFRSL